MHGELLQAHAQQEAGHGDFARHLATHRHFHAGPVGGADGMRDQIQDSRVQRVVEICHLIVRAVDGQGVLDQVVGSDGQVIELFHEQAER